MLKISVNFEKIQFISSRIDQEAFMIVFENEKLGEIDLLMGKFQYLNFTSHQCSEIHYSLITNEKSNIMSSPSSPSLRYLIAGLSSDGKLWN